MRGTRLVRELDPVDSMLFVIRGDLDSSKAGSSGSSNRAGSGTGEFCREEWLTWALDPHPTRSHRPQIDATPRSRIPARGRRLPRPLSSSPTPTTGLSLVNSMASAAKGTRSPELRWSGVYMRMGRTEDDDPDD